MNVQLSILCEHMRGLRISLLCFSFFVINSMFPFCCCSIFFRTFRFYSFFFWGSTLFLIRFISASRNILLLHFIIIVQVPFFCSSNNVSAYFLLFVYVHFTSPLYSISVCRPVVCNLYSECNRVAAANFIALTEQSEGNFKKDRIKTKNGIKTSSSNSVEVRFCIPFSHFCAEHVVEKCTKKQTETLCWYIWWNKEKNRAFKIWWNDIVTHYNRYFKHTTKGDENDTHDVVHIGAFQFHLIIAVLRRHILCMNFIECRSTSARRYITEARSQRGVHKKKTWQDREENDSTSFCFFLQQQLI